MLQCKCEQKPFIVKYRTCGEHDPREYVHCHCHCDNIWDSFKIEDVDEYLDNPEQYETESGGCSGLL